MMSTAPGEPHNQYESLKARMERTMDNLSAAKHVAYENNRPHVSPLRQRSPIYDPVGESAYRHHIANTVQQPTRSFRVPMDSELKPRRGSPFMEDDLRSTAHVTNLVGTFQHQHADLLAKIDTLQRERDFYANDARIEKQKNIELETEFHVLRELITVQNQQPPIGTEEVLMLKSQYNTERERRVSAENDAAKLRQQLADALAHSHRDVTNLKKALSDMQQQNSQNLQTIYEKGDQNLEQMQQLEDLSKLIREKDNEIESLADKLREREAENRSLHTQMHEVRDECAKLNADKGVDMLMKGSMVDALEQDPRYRKLVTQKSMAQQQEMQ